MNQQKCILVTGGAGFIGSTLLNSFVQKYPTYRFINLDALTAVADIQNVTVADETNYQFEKIDIRDMEALTALFERETITDIIHLAAESHVDVSIEHPQLFVETNVLGTTNLLSLALKYKVNRFHHVSTDEVYGSLNLSDNPFTEHSPLAPNSPYSASKASSDTLVRAFHKTYGLNTIITRCSNNYGPRQDRTKFIPNAMMHLLQHKPIPVYGDGSNVRDWLHVDDHVRALDLAFHDGVAGEVYNIGGGVEKTNLEVATLLTELAQQPNAVAFVPDRKGHDFRYAIDDTKLQQLGYAPTVPFQEGLAETVSWYQGLNNLN